jgi:hypothetical protein
LTGSRRPAERPSRPSGQRPTARPSAQRPANRPSTRFRTPPPRQSFLERYRLWILGGAAVAAIAIVGFLALSNAAQPAYACDQQWQAPAATTAPAPTATPSGSSAPASTSRIGYVQPDMGRNHVAVGQTVEYPLCPPASGRHYNATGLGPIKAQVYGPDDSTLPEGWIHNLEHGGLVIVYRCPGPACEDAGQAAFRQVYAAFPPSPLCKLPVGAVGPVITRFDQMAYPMAALLWGQILPLETWDPNLVLAFFNQQAERTNPEPACPRPTPTPEASTAAPSGSPSAGPAASATTAPSSSPATEGSPATSPTPTPAPSSAG